MTPNDALLTLIAELRLRIAELEATADRRAQECAEHHQPG